MAAAERRLRSSVRNCTHAAPPSNPADTISRFARRLTPLPPQGRRQVRGSDLHTGIVSGVEEEGAGPRYGTSDLDDAGGPQAVGQASGEASSQRSGGIRSPAGDVLPDGRIIQHSEQVGGVPRGAVRAQHHVAVSHRGRHLHRPVHHGIVPGQLPRLLTRRSGTYGDAVEAVNASDAITAAKTRVACRRSGGLGASSRWAEPESRDLPMSWRQPTADAPGGALRRLTMLDRPQRARWSGMIRQ